MKEYTPKIREPFSGPECPLYNDELFICNITQNECPKQWYDDDDLESVTDEEYIDNFEFPDDCPAKEGVTISFPEK